MSSDNTCTDMHPRTVTPANSTSFELLSASENEDSYYYDYDFSISYDDGSYAYGSYMSDVLMLGGVPVSNLTMGLVNSTSTYHGVLGIGYNDSVYDNLPDRLRDQGVINSTAYSLWVDDEQASSGNLLFGAIDTAKFEGNLTRIISEYTTQMSVEIYGIDSSIPGGGNGSVAIVFPNETDSSDGSYYTGVYGYPFSATFSPPDSVSHLPTEIASQIWRMAGAYYDAEIELAVISCSTQNDTSLGNLTISLSPSADGPVITAPRVDLIIPAQDINISSYYSYYFDGDEGLCLFGVQNASLTGGFEYNLGSTLLRRTYSVFDLVNMEIAVAPVKFGATATSNIVNFSTYGAVVPSASMYCSSYTCSDDSSTNSGGDDDGNDTAALLGVLSLGALLGLSFGLGLGLLALGTAGFLIWRRRRKNALVAKDAGSVSSGEVDNTAAAPAAMSGAATAWRGITESARGAPDPQDANGASLPVAPAGEHFHAEGSTNAGLASEVHDAQAGSSSSSDVDRNA